MAQSLNKTVLLNTTGTSYLSIAGKVGKFLSEIRLWNFTPMSMLNNLSRFLGAISTKLGQMSLGKISRHFEVFTDRGKFLFASKDSGAILKIAREKLGNDKVVKLPTLIQTISQKFKIYLQKVETLV